MGWRAAVGALTCLLVACGQGVGRGGNGLPGSDAGQETTGDAGGDGGGPAGADGAGLPPDAGVVDAGTPVPDGGNPGPTICTDPAPAEVCDALAPPLGASVVHRYLEVLDGGDGENLFCGTGTYPASGNGVVLHPVQVQGRPPSLAFVDHTGQDIATYGNFSLAIFEIRVIPTPTGFGIFAPYQGGLGAYPVALVDDHAVWRGGTQGFDVAGLPGGGVGVFSFRELADGCDQDTRLLVQRFEERGTPALGDPTDLGCYSQVPNVVMAGNATGQVLVLVGPYNQGWTGWEGHWLDRDLGVVQKFTTPELAAAANNTDAAISALIDGSFVIRLGGQWAHRIQPGATTLEPAPCWLTSRPSTDLVAIRGGTAYAALHRGSEECDRVVEVLTPEGRTCGFTAVSGTDGRCELAVGGDGTVSKGAEVVPAGAGQPRSCVLEFWPGALGRTGY